MATKGKGQGAQGAVESATGGRRSAGTASKVRRIPVVLVIHGPNLNLLGAREPEIYGRTTLRELDRRLVTLGRELGVKVATFQSNSEGAIVDRIQAARGQIDVLIVNPAAYTHTSIAVRDAIAALDAPVIEVHLSNVYKREAFRHHSTIADVVTGRIMGFGAESYILALRAAVGIGAATAIIDAR
ncbi:MAG: type II 3-dehydroquinate dehydratase [Candidatus Binataceae bacterium]